MSLEWFDFVGLAGIGFVLVSFLLLQAGKLTGDSLGYQLANLFGAIFILVSIFGPSPDFRDVISITIMQLAWIVISCYGLWRGVKSRAASFRRPKDPANGG
ncbi:CBU_0592 family membrane protein [Arenimonas alkanexedens]